MAGRAKAIVINERDNVATALVALPAGAAVTLTLQGRKEKVPVRSAVPMGHKFALREIPPGAEVVKYGEAIGKASAPIGRGEHVHVHNVASRRWQKGGA